MLHQPKTSLQRWVMNWIGAVGQINPSFMKGTKVFSPSGTEVDLLLYIREHPLLGGRTQKYIHIDKTGPRTLRSTFFSFCNSLGIEPLQDEVLGGHTTNIHASPTRVRLYYVAQHQGMEDWVVFGIVSAVEWSVCNRV